MAAPAAMTDLQIALRRDQSVAAARQASETAHFLRFTACLSRRLHPNAKA